MGCTQAINQTQCTQWTLQTAKRQNCPGTSVIECHERGLVVYLYHHAGFFLHNLLPIDPSWHLLQNHDSYCPWNLAWKQELVLEWMDLGLILCSGVLALHRVHSVKMLCHWLIVLLTHLPNAHIAESASCLKLCTCTVMGIFITILSSGNRDINRDMGWSQP